MSPPAPRQRPPGSRLVQRGARHLLLESAAAEYAMLAQRRSRLARQIELLDRQRAAAGAGFAQLSRRMAQLAHRLSLPAEAVAPPPLPAWAAAEAGPDSAPLPAPATAPPAAPRRRPAPRGGVTHEY
ncbi:hypothetical protein [Roseomonas sp. USHLN139]|uniref:hypothetical protein n=1 Tax=Roseomonas sp. USHLN139 TaxID=3081298 RepID=UPI003B01DE1E